MKLAPFALLAAMSAVYALPSAAHAENYPVVASDTQQDRDAQRRSILTNELATEKKSLSDVNAEMADAIKAQKSPEDVQAIAAQALGHSNNIESLQRELDGLGGKVARPRRAAFVPEAQPEAPAPSAQAPADVPYWDVYHRKQNVPQATPEEDQDDGAALNDSPDAGDKEARSGSTK
ncbi:TPA: hypothetical protein ACGCG4_004476 [Enterobacter hormaechei]